MNRIKLETAVAEAKRFLERVEALKRESGGDPRSVLALTGHYYSYQKQTAAVRRASMDLTRALAELRKPG